MYLIVEASTTSLYSGIYCQQFIHRNTSGKKEKESSCNLLACIILDSVLPEFLSLQHLRTSSGWHPNTGCQFPCLLGKDQKVALGEKHYANKVCHNCFAYWHLPKSGKISSCDVTMICLGKKEGNIRRDLGNRARLLFIGRNKAFWKRM